MKTFLLGLLGLSFASALVLFVPKQAEQQNTNNAITTVVLEPILAKSVRVVAKRDTTKTIRHFTDLTNNNTVTILDEITERANSTAQEILTKSKREKEVFLLINSPGGSVLDGAQIVSAIQASKVPVHTVCIQLCASMAAIIHAYGTDRNMVDRAVLMYHQAAGGVQGYVPQMLTRLNFIDSYTKKMDAYIATRAGVDVAQFEASLSDEVWLDTEDATAKHFNDFTVSLDLSRFQKEATDAVENSVKRTTKRLEFGAY